MQLLPVMVAAMAGLSMAHPNHPTRRDVIAPRGRCGAPEPSRSNIEASRRMAKQQKFNPEVALQSTDDQIELGVYFHIISDGTDPVAEGGTVLDTALNAQLSTLNADYQQAGISFKLVNTTRTVNKDWFHVEMNSDQEIQMKKALRKGTYRDINIYFASLTGGVLGWCTYPETNPSDHQITADGCAVAFASLPGGTAPYNLGRTLTHELGHWLNLFHTFQGGCSAENDSVEDTPAEQGPTYGCPATPVDTCTGPGFDGLDNTNNFMNYVDDSCMTNFTSGQITRMHQSFNSFRKAI
ncbi:Similar to Extracellular metalloprotease GLRG_06286; acc. no. E3QJV4 [Pyronema omphalodes CBS 100304]|uniref:Similar to Extracellular metalloprotease GLRG_06286 acc. no. E3QJV4 n=1 Tax=Pyronema omphalodes (strain CBS 100304) TaxID=1076935 RepID=U4KWL1_PYROM|nr:Similar to Extracellular metalloprotease GLRG_06286; acc. no. E3QJV4 [Pyronema omphalodes CBS 100304]